MTKLSMMAISAMAILAAPAAAQVNGFATADTAVAIAGTQALQTGYQQIGTQYQSQRQTLEQRQQQRNTLVQQLDTDQDGQLSETEVGAAADATVQQVQALDQEIAQIQAPIQLARLYVVEQILQQYSPAVQQVISDRGIQMLISPDAVIYAPDSADVTQVITQTLNTRAPSVTITPPEGWQPNQTTVQVFQQVQQVLMLAALQQQQQGQQQQSAQQPAQQAAPAEQPEGR